MAAFEGGAPRREDLDRIVPGSARLPENRDGHSAWVNTRALELAGVTAATADPADGRIERDADGTPSGHAPRGRDGPRRPASCPTTPRPTWRRGSGSASAHLHSLGITAWQDAIVEPDGEERAYVALASRGELTGRVVGALVVGAPPGRRADRGVRRAPPRHGHRQVRPDQRQADDGRRPRELHRARCSTRISTATAGPQTTAASSRSMPEGLRTWVPQLDALGFQPHFHAIGDRAVRVALDAVEAARRANGPSDTRPHIAHIQVIHPDDIGRFRELDVVANAQPLWAAHEDQMDVLTIPFIGDRWRWQYPFRSLRAAGAVLAMGSDWSVSSANPLWEMEIAVERARRRGWYASAIEREVFLPGRATRADRRARGVHDRLGLRQPPRHVTGHARSREVRRLGRPRPRPVRPRCRRDRRRPGRRDVRRGRSRVRGRRARRLSEASVRRMDR